MPRGFLVKRHRRGAASYRTRSLPLLQVPDGEFPVACVRDALESEQRAQLPEADRWSPGGDFSRFFLSHEPRVSASRSAVSPVGTARLAPDGGGKHPPFTGSSPEPELPEQPFHRSSTPSPLPAYAPPYGHDPSPAHVSLFAPLTAMHAAKTPALTGSRLHKAPVKKTKVHRKLNFEDEVTTSPVLGLRIKKESPERRPGGTGNPPLGEFICQLCKEQYRDPFSLAQHKCSRIVRVEYRCPECDKVFSCPANLASHRRWHKPRPLAGQPGDVPPLKSPALTEARDHLQHGRLPVETEGKENDRHRPLAPYWELAEQRVPGGRTLLTGSTAELPGPFVPGLAEEEVYDCRYCGKRFRRQAYLKKHLSAHEATAHESRALFLCHLCGARFPSMDIRDKHRLWHAELLSGGTAFHALSGEQQMFTCTHCPSTFFSSPGLTRHMKKSHPGDPRPVVLLQMTVTP